MPGTYIYTSYQDSRGFLWVCTTGGLSRFDGKHFVNYGLIDGLPTNRVTNIQEDTTGNLWIGTRNGLCKFDGRHFKSYPIPNVTGTTYFFDLSLSPQKLIQFNVNGYHFFIRQDSLIKAPRVHLPAMADTLVRNILQLPGGDSLINTIKGKTFLVHKNVIIHTYPEIDNTFVTFQLYNNQVYAFSEKGIYIITADDCKQVFTFPKTTVSLLWVLFDKRGQIWISLEESGVLVYNPQTNSGQFLPGIPSTFSASVYEDRQGTIWVNNSRGLLKLSPSFTQLFNKQYLPEQDSKGLFTMPDGDVYFSTQTYVYKDIYGSVTPLPQQVHNTIIAANDHYNIITGMTAGKGNVTWMTSFIGSIYRYADNILINMSDKFKLGGLGVSDIKYSPKDDVLLIPQSHFLLKLHDDKADTIRQTTDGTPIGFITRMVLHSNGDVWMIDKRNIYTYNGRELINMRPSLNPGNVEIGDIYFSGDEVWVATAGLGLLRYRQSGNGFTRLNQFTTADGLSNNTLMSVVRDNNGSYWVCGSSGIDQLKLITSDKFLIRHYTAENGIPAGDWSYARLATSKDGFVWCVNGDGILRIQPSVISKDIYPPIVHIENVSAINQQLTWQNADTNTNNFFHLPPTGELAYNVNDLTFHFTGIGFTSSIVKYMYMLQGVDKKWITSDKEDAIYLSLPPGTYTFKVKAINNSGTVSQEKRYIIKILPPFWRTWWFRSVLVIVAVGLIFYLVKLREKNLKKQNMLTLQMSELKMQALQSQMNPHFIFNSLNSIQNYIVNNDVMNAATYLSKFSKLIRRILDNSNHTLLPFEQIIETLRMYVEMEAFRFNNEFTYRFDVDEELLNLKLPPMLLQPFVENAIWHGLMPKKGPKELTIKIARGNAAMVCIIDDNGMGRNQQQKKEGHTSRGENMTKGMIESLKQLQGIDARMQVVDKKDDTGAPAGTTVIIIIPIN